MRADSCKKLALRRDGIALQPLLEDGEEPVDHGDVGAAGKILLARADDDALDRGVAGRLFDDRLKLVHHLFGEDVHRAARHVPGDERDAVGVRLDAEILVAHVWPSVGRAVFVQVARNYRPW